MRIRLTAIVMVFAILASLNNRAYGQAVGMDSEPTSSANPYKAETQYTPPKEEAPKEEPALRPYVADQNTAVDPNNIYIKPEPNIPESVNTGPTSDSGQPVVDATTIGAGAASTVVSESAKKTMQTTLSVVGHVNTVFDVAVKVYYGQYEDAVAAGANGVLGGVVTSGGMKAGAILGAKLLTCFTPPLGTVIGTIGGALVGAAVQHFVVQPAVGAVVDAISLKKARAELANKMNRVNQAKALAAKLITTYNVPEDKVLQAMLDYMKGKKIALIDLRNEQLKAMKEKEASTQVDLESLDDKLNKMPINQTFFNDKDKDADDKASQALNLMDAQNALANTGTASDDAKAQAANMRNEAGEDAIDITKQAANESADDKNKNSWGNIITGKIADGIEKGGTTAAETIGDAAADGAVKEVFPKKQTSSKPSTPPPPPAPVTSEPTCPGY